MRKIILFLCVLIVASLFLVSCAEEMSDEELEQELEQLSDEELDVIASEEDGAVAGQATRRYRVSRSRLRDAAVRVRNRARQCTDSDLEDDIYVKGEVLNARGGPGGAYLGPQYDKCREGKIHSVRCGENGVVAWRGLIECPGDFFCRDGKCTIFEDENLELAVKRGGTLYPERLERIPRLTALGSEITSLAGIEHLTGLDSVFLGRNQIRYIEELAGLRKMKQLLLHNNLIDDLSALQELVALESLVVGGNQIDDISHLSGLSKLQRLNIGGNPIDTLSAITRMGSLRTISVQRTNIDDLSPLFELVDYQKRETGSVNLESVDANNIPELENNLGANCEVISNLEKEGVDVTHDLACD